jgi:von Willebrand factor type A domain
MAGAAKVFLAIVLLLVFLPSVLAQHDQESPSVTRSIVANVLDTHGNAVRDLTKENFHLRVNGKPTEVLDARYSLAPRRIVALLDVSGSMTGEKANGKWRIAREAADDLLAETPDDVSIAMLTFSGKVRDVVDFSRGRTAIATWLREDPGQRPNRKYSPKTALFDAILEGLRLLQPVQPGDAVYVITDGGDNASQASADKTRSALLQSGVRLFAFLFAEPLKPSSEEEGKDAFLSMVADSGGFVFGVSGHQPVGSGFPWAAGSVYNDDHPERVRLLTQLLNIQLNGFWTLELEAPLSNKTSNVKLEIAADEGSARKDVGVTYVRLLLPKDRDHPR